MSMWGSGRKAERTDSGSSDGERLATLTKESSRTTFEKDGGSFSGSINRVTMDSGREVFSMEKEE